MGTPQGQQHQHSPAMERYLREGNKEHARLRGQRDGYPSGPVGMADYLDDWEKKWKEMSGKTNKKGNAYRPSTVTSSCSHRPYQSRA